MRCATGIDNTNTDTLYSTMAPVIAASMQLQSAEQAEYLLRWLDTNQNLPIISASQFWSKIQLENLTPLQKISCGLLPGTGTTRTGYPYLCTQ